MSTEILSLMPVYEGEKTLIAQAVLVTPKGLVMQLRDFKADIIDPGKWGCFAGAVEANENPDSAIKREISEETGLTLNELEKLGVFHILNRQMHVYVSQLQDARVDLQEGADWGVFSIEEILSGLLYSQRFSKFFPLTFISNAILRWIHANRPSVLCYGESLFGVSYPHDHRQFSTK